MNIFLKFIEKYKSRIDIKVTSSKFSPSAVKLTHSSEGMFGLNSILLYLSDQSRTSYFSFNPWIAQVEQKISNHFDASTFDSNSYVEANDSFLKFYLSITECENRELLLNTPLLAICNQELLNMNEE